MAGFGENSSSWSQDRAMLASKLFFSEAVVNPKMRSCWDPIKSMSGEVMLRPNRRSGILVPGTLMLGPHKIDVK